MPIDSEAKNPQITAALANVRAATQELHGAISDAAAKRGAAVKVELEAVPQKAKAVADSIRSALASQNEVSKKHLTEAVTHLEATQKHAAESLKSSGQAFQTAVRQAMTDARAAAQKVSEAVAATRSAESTQSAKK